MHLITLRIISNISVLVIAATLSTVGAGKCPPEGLESNRSDRDPLVERRELARRPDSYEGKALLVGPENRVHCGSAAAPGREKWGKKKAGIQRTRLIVNQLRSSYPGLAVVYFGPQSGSSRTIQSKYLWESNAGAQRFRPIYRLSASYSGTGGGLLRTPKWLGWYEIY